MPWYFNKPTQHLIQYALGLIVLLLGLSVLIGWYTKSSILIQVMPEFPPMQFNTALGFILSGLGIVTNNKLPRLSQLLGFIIFTLGLLTLIEYCFSVNLHIDEFFMVHDITVGTSHPGRMTPNTALSFLLTGACISVQALHGPYQRYFQVTSLALVLLIFLLSLVALFGYIGQIPSTYGWGQLTRMAIHTVLGFIVISLALIPALWHKTQLSSIQNNIALPYIVFIFGSLLFLALGYGISHFLFQSAKTELNKMTVSFSSQLSTEIKNHLKSVHRLFDRMNSGSYTSEKAWQKDARHYIRDVSSIKAISLLKPSGGFSPVILKENDINLKKIIMLNKKCDKLFNKTPQKLKKSIIVFEEPLQRNYLCIHDPTLDIVVLLDIKTLLNNIFNKRLATDNFISLQKEGKTIYLNKPTPKTFAPPFKASTALNVQKTHFELHVTPHPDFIEDYASSIPTTFVIVGILTTFLLSISLRLWQVSSARRVEVEKNAAQISYLAYHDPLTGLLNRAQYEEMIENAIRRCKQCRQNMAVLFIDLDRFKHVNDTYGHEAGDNFLIAVANMLKQNVSDKDSVFRVGGDEFGILLDNIKTLEEAGFVAHKILKSFKAIVKKDNRHVGVTSSIGIASYPISGEDAPTLIKNADIALYHAKGNGKNTYRYFSKELDLKSKHRIKIESHLFQAYMNKEFYLVYQPIIDLKTTQIVGFEVLIRWDSPKLGIVKPDDFIPIAEETHVIIDIGRWVFQKAVETFSTYYKKKPDLKLNINLSPQQVYNDTWIEYAMHIIDTFNIPPKAIVFELTETDLIRDLDNLRDKVSLLVQHGFSLFVDDFGTGYSSLQLIQKLPLAGLKIDKSFVSDLSERDKEGKMLRSIISLASLHHLLVITEGVETEEQAHFIKANDCQYAQGYHFYKPLEEEKLKTLF